MGPHEGWRLTAGKGHVLCEEETEEMKLNSGEVMLPCVLAQDRQ